MDQDAGEWMIPASRTKTARPTDELNHLWIQEYTLPGEGGGKPVWTVFDPDGHVLGFMETPAGLRVFQIGEDHILGYVTDELGVEYVQVWSLSRWGG